MKQRLWVRHFYSHLNAITGSLMWDSDSGYCPNALSFPTKHLLFGKDYIGMALTSGQTFVHVTAAGRPEDTDYFYRVRFEQPNSCSNILSNATKELANCICHLCNKEIVIPHLRSSLHPPLNAAALKQPKKSCEHFASLI